MIRRLSFFSIYALFCIALLGQAQQALQVPLPLNPDSVRFAVIGDTGTGGTGQYEVGEQLMKFRRTKLPFEFVIMLGDNLYGNEGAKDFVNKFEKPYKGLLDLGVKFYAALGNHDETAVQTAYKPFNMNGNRYYTFKPRDGIRFFVLDSNYMDKEQIAWFENELKNSGSDWKICFFHHPMYSSGKHGSNLELRSLLEPMMSRYGVDVVFAGHEHFYERIKPQKGIHHFVVGASAKLRRGDIRKTSLTAKGFDQDYAFLVAEVAGDEIVFQTISRTGAIVDSGRIRRAEERPQIQPIPK